MKVLLLDNFDSFTYNLSHYLQIAGATVAIKRNNDSEVLNAHNYDAFILSPGPCTPNESGFLMEFVSKYSGVKPILGVCLGMQAIGLHFGWDLIKANEPKHGKTSKINHQNKGIFKGLPNPMQVGRYHSLVIHPNQNANTLVIDAECDGEIMAVSAPELNIYAVQFHPESILTPNGQKLIQNWMNLIGA